jgi:hypothetical protein
MAFDHAALGRVGGLALVDVLGTAAIAALIAYAGGARSVGAYAGVVASTFAFGVMVHASLGISTPGVCGASS